MLHALCPLLNVFFFLSVSWFVLHGNCFFISYLSLIAFIFSTFAIMRVLSALLSSLPNKSVTLIFFFFFFIYVMSTLGASRKTAFCYTGPTISKILYYLLLSSIEKLESLR